MKYSEESLFCAKYLFDCGYTVDDIEKMRASIPKLKTQFSLCKIQRSFFTEVATALRELWPAGEKDGKWPWRDSVSNLSRRLEFMWTTLLTGKHYTQEQVLLVARKYLNQFENDTKYMQLLKYFIFKQERTIAPGGKIRYINSSKLANMLLSAEEDGTFAELEFPDTSEYSFVEEGELI